MQKALLDTRKQRRLAQKATEDAKRWTKEHGRAMKPVSGGGNDNEAQKTPPSALAPEHLVDLLVTDGVKPATVKELAFLPSALNLVLKAAA